MPDPGAMAAMAATMGPSISAFWGQMQATFAAQMQQQQAQPGTEGAPPAGGVPRPPTVMGRGPFGFMPSMPPVPPVHLMAAQQQQQQQQTQQQQAAVAVAAPSGEVAGANLTGASGASGAGVLEGAMGSAEQTRAERRAAAYEKFRQKKKSLNFGKKIRYASRKQLAEARPRVKGQFVKVNAEKKGGASGSAGGSGGTSGSGGKAGGSGGESNSADPTTLAQPMQVNKE